MPAKKLVSISIYLSETKAKLVLREPSCGLLGSPTRSLLSVGMIRSVKKVFHNASRTQVQVQSWTIPFWGHCGQLGPFRGVNYRFLGF